MFRVDVAQPDPRDDRIHIEDVGHKCDGLLPASTREHGTAEHAAPLKDSLESGTDLQGIRDAYARLETATFQIAEAMYGPADEASGGGTPAA